MRDTCVPPPGTLVRPPYANFSPEVSQPALPVWQRFAGGVIAARLLEFSSNEVVPPPASWKLGPSRLSSVVALGSASDFDEVTDEWAFRPVNDMGCEPGVVYGIWFSAMVEGDPGAIVHLESRSNNGLPGSSTDLWINGGGSSALAGPANRHSNANSMPDTMDWRDLGGLATVLPVGAGFFGMWPMGGNGAYGQWPMDAGEGDAGLAFKADETITLRAWVEEGTGDATIYLDHLVFMPTYPMGKSAPLRLDSSDNFQSSALEATGYYPTSAPASIVQPEPADAGTLYGYAVADSQVLTSIFDPDMHWTVASHDESDAVGLFTGVGGVHVYVLVRGYKATLGTVGGHVSCFTGSHMLSDILVDAEGGWCWAYAGVMPLGDGPQQAFGMVQWINDSEVFWGVNTCDQVRTFFIAYIPQSPCLDEDATAGRTYVPAPPLPDGVEAPAQGVVFAFTDPTHGMSQDWTRVDDPDA